MPKHYTGHGACEYVPLNDCYTTHEGREVPRRALHKPIAAAGDVMEHHRCANFQCGMIDHIDICNCADMDAAAPIESEKLRLGSCHLTNDLFKRQTWRTIASPVRETERRIGRVANLREVGTGIPEAQHGIRPGQDLPLFVQLAVGEICQRQIEKAAPVAAREHFEKDFVERTALTRRLRLDGFGRWRFIVGVGTHDEDLAGIPSELFEPTPDPFVARPELWAFGQ